MLLVKALHAFVFDADVRLHELLVHDLLLDPDLDCLVPVWGEEDRAVALPLGERGVWGDEGARDGGGQCGGGPPPHGDAPVHVHPPPAAHPPAPPTHHTPTHAHTPTPHHPHTLHSTP